MSFRAGLACFTLASLDWDMLDSTALLSCAVAKRGRITHALASQQGRLHVLHGGKGCLSIKSEQSMTKPRGWNGERFSHGSSGWCSMQVGLVKKYGDAEAVPGMLNLVKLELGMGPDIEFTQVVMAAGLSPDSPVSALLLAVLSTALLLHQQIALQRLWCWSKALPAAVSKGIWLS